MTQFEAFHVSLTHFYNTPTVDGEVVARGILTIVPVLDVDGIRVDADALAVGIVVTVVYSDASDFSKPSVFGAYFDIFG